MKFLEPFSVVLTECNGRPVVQLEGDIDILAAPTMRDALCALVNVGEREIVLDLTHVKFMDSSGVGVIGEVVRAGAWVTIAGASPAAQRVLDLTGLSALCTTRADLLTI
jgi:anti-sigma B factor antagonist